ncbi:MAG: NUDIX domain-containing protein [Thermoplasmata archaeon]
MGYLERPPEEEVREILERFGRIRRRVVDWDLTDQEYTPDDPPCDGEVVPLVLDEEDRLAVVRQRDGPAYFIIPTGRINPGESVEAGAIREAWEETGCEVRVEDVAALHRVRIQFKISQLERWYFIVLCRVEGPVGSPLDTEEISEVKFVDLPGEMPVEWAQSEWYVWVLKDASLLHPHSFLVGKPSSE